MKKGFYSKSAFLQLTVILLIFSCEKKPGENVTWRIDSTKEIGGHATIHWGNPSVIEDGGVEVLEFNGINDGLLVNHNPVAGMEEFRIELDFKPYRGFPENREQRFLHIQDPDNENRRILIELRLNEQEEWYGDWYIKSENEKLTLIDSRLTHPVNEWATISLVYKDGVMKGYVNGKEELSGRIDYLPIDANGKTSIGTRMDKRSWFKGAIKEVRFSPVASD